MAAVAGRNPENVRILLDAGAKVDARESGAQANRAHDRRAEKITRLPSAFCWIVARM